MVFAATTTTADAIGGFSSTIPSPNTMIHDSLSFLDQGIYFLIFIFILFFTCIFVYVDTQMQSPPESPPRLRGSSKVTGGLLRGHAYGNTLNAADYQDQTHDDMLHPIIGKVLVYTSNDDPANLSIHNMKPTLFIKHPVTRSIQPVLTKVAAKFSPIQSKYCYYHG
jgi:hypothetical protein